MIATSNAASGTFIEEFQREMQMTLAYGSAELGAFPLNGTRKAFSEVIECQQTHEANAAADPVAAALAKALAPVLD